MNKGLGTESHNVIQTNDLNESYTNNLLELLEEEDMQGHHTDIEND